MLHVVVKTMYIIIMHNLFQEMHDVYIEHLIAVQNYKDRCSSTWFHRIWEIVQLLKVTLYAKMVQVSISFLVIGKVLEQQYFCTFPYLSNFTYGNVAVPVPFQ